MTTKTLTINGTEITKGSAITIYNGEKVVRRTLTVTHVEDCGSRFYVTAKTSNGTRVWMSVKDGNKLLAKRFSSERKTNGYRKTQRTAHRATHITAA